MKRNVQIISNGMPRLDCPTCDSINIIRCGFIEELTYDCLDCGCHWRELPQTNGITEVRIKELGNE